MVWNRPATIGGELGRIATSINGLLIIWFAVMTWVTGMKKNFEAHRKWAIRTYVVVNGVWFFRIGFGTWLLVTGFSAHGMTQNLTGWFDRILYFSSYLVPLLICEVYIRVKASDNALAMKWLSIVLFLLCPLLLASTYITANIFWLS